MKKCYNCGARKLKKVFKETNKHFEVISLEGFAFIISFIGLFHCTGSKDFFIRGQPNICNSCFDEALKLYKKDRR